MHKAAREQDLQTHEAKKKRLLFELEFVKETWRNCEQHSGRERGSRWAC